MIKNIGCAQLPSSRFSGLLNARLFALLSLGASALSFTPRRNPAGGGIILFQLSTFEIKTSSIMDAQVVAIAQDILVLKVGFNRQFTTAMIAF